MSKIGLGFVGIMSYQNVGVIDTKDPTSGDEYDHVVFLCSPACRALFEIESNYWEHVRVRNFELCVFFVFVCLPVSFFSGLYLIDLD